jgi:hypothetical protein
MKLEYGYLYRPQYWRLKAEETRALAEQMTIAECRDQLLHCANAYEAMANCLDHNLRDLLGMPPEGPSVRERERKVTPFRPTG